MKNRVFRNFVIFAVLLLAALLGGILYVSDYYHASASVQDFLTDRADSSEVTVEEIQNGYFWDGPGESAALVFYPGGKVEYTAYAPLLHMLAKEGIDCFLLEMPGNLAILGKNRGLQ